MRIFLLSSYEDSLSLGILRIVTSILHFFVYLLLLRLITLISMKQVNSTGQYVIQCRNSSQSRIKSLGRCERIIQSLMRRKMN